MCDRAAGPPPLCPQLGLAGYASFDDVTMNMRPAVPALRPGWSAEMPIRSPGGRDDRDHSFANRLGELSNRAIGISMGSGTRSPCSV